VDDEPEEHPYDGKLREAMDLLAAKKHQKALDFALKWRESDPGDALALIALGEAFEALGRKGPAARAYGSIIDLFPSRADLRRFAGARLERLGMDPEGGLDLAMDTYRKAVDSRPDHPAGHRLLAFALARAGKIEKAFEAILAGYLRGYPSGRFAGVREILHEDVGLIAAAWIKAQPAKREAILARVRKAGAEVATLPSLRFVLNWETDANDVDFHIFDGRGGHADYSEPALLSGGELYADVTTGYGPECFTIPGRARAYPYRMKAHYYSKGPMGYGMGKLQIIEHDGKGGLKFDERPFVVMTDRAFVDLGKVTGPLKGP
jgi:tetratricopeptide (TPR) repeat protein